MRVKILEQSFQPQSLGAGNYLAVSNTPAYSILRAMALNGMGDIVSERYEPGGLKSVVVHVYGSVRPNGQMKLGRRFFEGALKDYSDWRIAWWRECVQNAVDAGASNVELDAAQLEDGTWQVSCSDDGRGMDQDTIVEKFLAFGETTKEQGDTAGGFGKAKEVLILPWLGWSLESRDTLIEGVAASWDDQFPKTVPRRKGTKLTVRMPADEYTSGYHAAAFLERCNISGVSFTINGRSTSAKQHPGRLLMQNEKAKVYYNKSAPVHGIFVRTKGLYMFSEWMSSDAKGAVFVEITVPSIEVLTSNRDAFQDRSLRALLGDVQRRIAVDPTSTLARSTLTRKVYRGSGLFNADAAASEVLANIPSMPKTGKGAIQLTKEAGEEMAQLVVEVVTEKSRERGWGDGAGIVDAEIAQAILGSVPILGQQHLENVTKQLVWSPDFYVVNEIEGFRVPKKYTPEGMAPMVLRLAKLWAELCRYVLAQLNCDKPFGVGFHFSDHSMASHSDDDGQHWLLVNPLAHVDEAQRMLPMDTSASPISYAKDQDLRNIYASAIHEATHMVDGISAHNEIFSSAFTKNLAICADGYKTARKIASLVGKRKVEGESDGPRTRAKKGTKAGDAYKRIEQFLTPIAYGAAGYLASRMGEPTEYAEREVMPEYAIPQMALEAVGSIVQPEVRSWGEEGRNEFVARDMFWTGMASPSASVLLKADVGADARQAVVIFRGPNESERWWQKMLNDSGRREMMIPVGYDVEYRVTFE
jgi:hypothetical protein